MGNENLHEAAGAETTRNSQLSSSQEPGMSRSKDARKIFAKAETNIVH